MSGVKPWVGCLLSEVDATMNSVLVLNDTYEPLNVVSVKRAVVLL